ncbi:MAG: hypothetical protein JWP63_2461, partial [Candidatus Solibacter sp.]|nr:hypothetical protein [Candidatus Solibacter sp.]
MLSRALVAALLALSLLTGQTPPNTDELEARLQSNPDDVQARAQILRTASLTTMPVERGKALRRKHLLWLIENKPGASVLGEMFAVVEKSGAPLADPELWADADRLWHAQIAGTPSQDIFANAVNFYRTTDLTYARELVDEGLAANPGNPRLNTAKGNLLALTVLGVKQVDRRGQATAFDDGVAKSEEAARARRELASTQSAQVIGSAADTLSTQLTALQMRNRTAELNSATALSEGLFQLALELEPNSARWKNGLASLYWTSASRKTGLAEKIALLEKSVRFGGEGGPRSYALADLAQAYFANGDMAKAGETATQSLAVPKSDGNYAGAQHNGNIVLGRIAVKKGDIEEGKRRLLAAGDNPGSPVLGSFGPNWNLAQELIAKGERETVLAYIELCRKFWKSGGQRLDTWASAIRAGNSPNFFGGPSIPMPQLVGRAAPGFRLRSLKGGELALEDFKGKVVLVDFWATWCAPCRAEMPHFETLHRELGSKDVVILAVDVNEDDDLVREYIGKEKYTFPVLFSKGADIVARYGVQAYPTLVAIDKAGLVADYLIGGRNEDKLREVIEKARAGAPPPSNSAPVSPISATPSAARPEGVPPPATAEDFFREGVRMHGAKDLSSAAKALDSAIALNPKMAPAWELRGHVNADLRRIPQAIGDYTRAIELFPYSAVAFHNRGLAYLDTNKLDDALIDFKRALELNPSYVLALQNRSRLYMTRKQYAEAIA